MLTLRHPATMKGLYWATGSLLAAQLIYNYHSELGWLYAIYFVTNLILTDLFAFNSRKPAVEFAVLMNYVLIAVGIISGAIASPVVLTAVLIPAGVYNAYLSYKG